MIETLSALPIEFWFIGIILVFGFIRCGILLKSGLGIPMAVILMTLSVWYILDVFYNEYEKEYMQFFSEDVLTQAWRQVLVFISVFFLFTPFLHSYLNRRYIANGSQIYNMFLKGVNNFKFQFNLTMLYTIVLPTWLIVMFVAIFRFQSDYFNFLFPYLGSHPGPWLTTNVGGGLQTIFALSVNMHMLVAAVFGVIAALSINKRIRAMALLGVLLSWPLFIFDRTRGYILLIVIPGLLAWTFLRARGGLLKKVAFLAVAYMCINVWFGFIIAVRSDQTLTDGLQNGSFSLSESSKEHHQGLNMFEELSWIIKFTENGTFNPGIGENYFANIVNLVPRDLWPSKPGIGIDYAIARGMGGGADGAGVFATLSEGMIGQGVVNFGLYLGPAFAAILMSLWASLLARIDLVGEKIGYLPLYAIGLIITFNMGRDITFMNLYPFFFGYIICIWLNRQSKKNNTALPATVLHSNRNFPIIKRNYFDKNTHS